MMHFKRSTAPRAAAILAGFVSVLGVLLLFPYLEQPDTDDAAFRMPAMTHMPPYDYRYSVPIETHDGHRPVEQ